RARVRDPAVAALGDAYPEVHVLTAGQRERGLIEPANALEYGPSHGEVGRCRPGDTLIQLREVEAGVVALAVLKDTPRVLWAARHPRSAGHPGDVRRRLPEDSQVLLDGRALSDAVGIHEEQDLLGGGGAGYVPLGARAPGSAQVARPSFDAAAL